MCAPAKKRCIPPIHPPSPACRRRGTFDVITRRGMNWGVEGGIICSKVTPGRGECVPRALLKINAIMLIPLLSNILGGKFKVFLISAPAERAHRPPCAKLNSPDDFYCKEFHIFAPTWKQLAWWCFIFIVSDRYYFSKRVVTHTLFLRLLSAAAAIDVRYTFTPTCSLVFSPKRGRQSVAKNNGNARTMRVAWRMRKDFYGKWIQNQLRFFVKLIAT
jgi:hypothetical protein